MTEMVVSIYDIYDAPPDFFFLKLHFKVLLILIYLSINCHHVFAFNHFDTSS